MMKIKLPSFARRYGLLLSDTEALMVSWSRGAFERIALFSNDESGVQRFSEFLRQNAGVYKNAGLQIMANVIGEDYRVEKIAHLIGKYKTDFHARRMTQLFRGTKLCMSIVQGREERGRREDIVLFYGLLTENKVAPWMTAISRVEGVYLAGVHGVSFVSAPILSTVAPDWQRGNHLLMTIHERGLLRQTQYTRGKIRFSRVSKINDESVEDVAAAIKKELERTLQYLNSLKISVASGINVQFVCPGAMVGQLREIVVGTERVRFHFHDAGAVAQKMGLSGPIGEIGKDSSLSLHSMFSHIWIKQLAEFAHVRYYWIRAVGLLASVFFVLYGLYGSIGPSRTFWEGYALSGDVKDLTEQRDQRKSQYESELQFSEDPPSDPENVRSVSRVFRLLDNISVSPTQLMYYAAVALEKNQRVRMDSIRWYVANSPDEPEASIDAFFTGEDIHQVLELEGEFIPIANENYLDVADRADRLVASFEKRDDIAVEQIELPGRDLDTDVLSGQLSAANDVEAARERGFKLRVIWRAYSRENLETLQEKV